MLSPKNISDFKRSLNVFGAAMQDIEVRFVEEPATPYTIKGHIGIRSSSSPLRNSISSDITGGADQDTYVCIFLCEDWDAVSPNRPPKKGDIVKANGMRYAIDRTVLSAPGGVKMVYKSQLKG